MKYHLEVMGNQWVEAASEIIYSQSSNQPYRSTKLGDKFKLERNYSSSAEFRHKVIKNRDNTPEKSKAFRQKQPAKNKADELVRYMSNLPNYLEKGGKIEEKAFHFGVLEWRRLEKWQYNQGHVPPRSCKSSPSNSNASSLSSTEGSSSNSGRGQSCSPARQRLHHPGVEPNCSSSPSRVCSRSIKSFELSGRKFQDLAASSSNYVKVSQSILSTHKCFHKYTDNQFKECKNKDQDPMCISEKRESRTENLSVISGSKGKMKLLDSEPLEVKEMLQSPSNHIGAQSKDSGHQLELLKPQDELECRSFVPSTPPLANKNLQGAMEDCRQSFSDISNYDANNKLSPDMPRSCPFPREVSTFMIEKSSSTTAKSLMSPEPLSFSRKFSASPRRDGNSEGKKSIRTLCSSPEAPNLKSYTQEDSKVRHPSPIRRLVARIGRNTNTKDTSCVPPCSPDADKLRSSGAETTVSSADSSCEKSNASGKGRSSPLRRLLDPLLKPRSSNVDNLIVSAQRDASSIDMACKLSKGQGESLIRHPVKVKLDLGSCKTVDIDHPQDIGKCGQLMVQALFQVAVKNGLPLFTFAVDNSSDILAATMRKLGSGKKDGNRWIYTFFTIHEMKKKNGSWLNQGNKDRSHGYIPNVVAQMKVSDVASTDLVKPDSPDQCTAREFVLVAAKNRQGDEQMPDLHGNDELAATVLMLPNMAIRNLSVVEQNTGKVEELSTVDLKEFSQEVMQLNEGESSVKNLNLFGLAVILPDGNHGLPSEGEPSPLLHRWRSGGSCDCGGWDLGCRLKVLASQSTRASVPAKPQLGTGKFQLYSQNGALDRKPIFSLSPFEDGIYSVEFDSSLKLLQAFSICIAVLNGLQPAKFSEMGSCFEKKPSEESTVSETETENNIVRVSM